MNYQINPNITIIQVTGTAENIAEFAEHKIDLVKNGNLKDEFRFEYKTEPTAEDKAAGWSGWKPSIRIHKFDYVLIKPNFSPIKMERIFFDFLFITKNQSDEFWSPERRTEFLENHGE